MVEQADVVVVGMGPGGEELAGRLAEEGLDVVGVEGRLLGGECPYWGCVPSKMMLRAADLLAEARRVPGMAGSAVVSPDWTPVARAIRRRPPTTGTTRSPSTGSTGKGGRFVRGRGRLTGPGRVTVGRPVSRRARAVVVNPGPSRGRPRSRASPSTPYWTNRDAIETDDGAGVARGPRRRGRLASSSGRSSPGSGPR